MPAPWGCCKAVGGVSPGRSVTVLRPPQRSFFLTGAALTVGHSSVPTKLVVTRSVHVSITRPCTCEHRATTLPLLGWERSVRVCIKPHQAGQLQAQGPWSLQKSHQKQPGLLNSRSAWQHCSRCPPTFHKEAESPPNGRWAHACSLGLLTMHCCVFEVYLPAGVSPIDRDRADAAASRARQETASNSGASMERWAMVTAKWIADSERVLAASVALSVKPLSGCHTPLDIPTNLSTLSPVTMLSPERYGPCACLSHVMCKAGRDTWQDVSASPFPAPSSDFLPEKPCQVPQTMPAHYLLADRVEYWSCMTASWALRAPTLLKNLHCSERRLAAFRRHEACGRACQRKLHLIRMNLGCDCGMQAPAPAPAPARRNGTSVVQTH